MQPTAVQPSRMVGSLGSTGPTLESILTSEVLEYARLHARLAALEALHPVGKLALPPKRDDAARLGLL